MNLREDKNRFRIIMSEMQLSLLSFSWKLGKTSATNLSLVSSIIKSRIRGPVACCLLAFFASYTRLNAESEYVASAFTSVFSEK